MYGIRCVRATDRLRKQADRLDLEPLERALALCSCTRGTIEHLPPEGMDLDPELGRGAEAEGPTLHDELPIRR